jgi:multidrug efflux pump subunit AcrB
MTITSLQANIEHAHARFRPIVATGISIIAGNNPLEHGPSVRSCIAVLVTGGILSSLFLALVLVPIACIWLAPVTAPDGITA